MALKIRRGTETERSALTGNNPAMAEPIWVTDATNLNGTTGILYVGDGSTTGGIAINPQIELNKLSNVNTGSPTNGQVLQWNTTAGEWQSGTVSVAQELNDLTNVDAVTGVANNKVLKYDSTANGGAGGWVAGDEAFLSFNLDTQLAGKSIDNLGDVSTSGTDSPQPGQYLIWDNSNAQWKPGDLDLNAASITTLSADVNGSIFGDDSTQLVDAINSTIRLNNGVTDITGNTITSPSTLIVNVSGPTQTDDTILQVWNSDETTGFRINSLVGATSSNISGLTLNGFAGGFEDSGNEVKFTAGQYIGEISATAFDPDFNDGTKVLSSVILFRTDPNATIADDTAKGQIEFVTNAGTNTAPVPKTIVMDSEGRLGVNRTNARATIDINGVMQLEPQTAAPASPIIGMIAVADRANWNPAPPTGTTPYPVFYNGSAWQSMV
jgi:hypothetical protein